MNIILWINMNPGDYKIIESNLFRSQWSRGLRRGSAAACLLRLWVRIPPGAWMFIYLKKSIFVPRVSYLILNLMTFVQPTSRPQTIHTPIHPPPQTHTYTHTLTPYRISFRSYGIMSHMRCVVTLRNRSYSGPCWRGQRTVGAQSCMCLSYTV